MTDVQRGTKLLPISIEPRIDGVLVTQSEIKNKFSNAFVDDNTTPLTWTLEYFERGQSTPLTQFFDDAQSTESTIVFPMPDSFYADYKVWMILIRWNISVEQIYSDEAISIEIKDFVLGL